MPETSRRDRDRRRVAALAVAILIGCGGPPPGWALEQPDSPRPGRPTRPIPPELAAALSAYRTYVVAQADAFVRETARFVAAIQAGQLAEARRLYAPARAPYERIEPVAALFPDLIKRLDVRSDEFELRERDPAFVGFHRLEMVLFTRGTTEGLGEVAERLAAETVTLRDRIAALAVPPAKAVGAASALIEGIAATKISGEEERYSRTDLWDFQANIEGSKVVFTLLRPLLPDLDFVARVERSYKRVEDLLGRYRSPDGGFQSYDNLTARDRNALKGPITLLAEDLSTLRGRLGLD
ncbi:iron uptake system protein EfeO [Methylobacterium sp. A49B]|uniref:Iron uptake system protein EfeO n=1 Tax=Methylobacterium mesophilicum SR1.6/6 TaxID=908290 RepID=A0A6B9FMZ4_9HYPH|nr:iron uptake system protein EfeO [Methylobacterium mesophilicum]QGY03777.1 iron uptake system protein EfeO [Methylobacterium mesophilicum SR1.6/6]